MPESQTTMRDGQARVTVVDASPSWALPDFREMWRCRGVLIALTLRDIQVRYKQTVIGIAWAVVQPLMTMVVFSLIFGSLANLPSDGLPYPIFTMAAIIPWQFFSKALTQGSMSMVTLGAMMTKVYFPRLFAPLASILSGLIDFGIAFVILIGMMIYFGIYPDWSILALPAFILLAIATSFSVSLWLSAVNVKYRDVQHTLPFIAQIWMFITPVVYSTSLVPEHLRLFYLLNPMAGVIEGFRWALLGTEQPPDLQAIAISGSAMLVLLIGGLFYFNRTEKTFADNY